MELKNINQIKKDGLVVFMPSGIQATLFKEGDKILVQYPEMYVDKYTIEEFESIIKEGIFIFNEPSQLIMESKKKKDLKKYFYLKILIDGILRHICCTLPPVDARKKYEKMYPGCKVSVRTITKPQYDKLYKDNGNRLTFDAPKNMDLPKPMEPRDLPVDNVENGPAPEAPVAEMAHGPVNENITVQQATGKLEKDFNSIDQLIDYIEKDTSMMVIGYSNNLIDVLDDNGNIHTINIKGKLKEGYEQKDCPEGSIFKALKNKKKEYLTSKFKNELLHGLTIIAHEYPNVKVRQQAVTFMDELGLQEYYDIKKVQDFIKKHMEILKPRINEEYKAVTLKTLGHPLQGIANLIREKQVKNGFDPNFGNWLITTSLDEKWESLTDFTQDILLDIIAGELYDNKVTVTDFEVKVNNYDFEKEDLISLDMFPEEDIEGYIKNDKELTFNLSYDFKYDNKTQESFKLKKKKKTKLDEITLKEDIYLKDETGKEEGPFVDQQAKEDFIKDQKKNGMDKNYEEIIKEDYMKKTAKNEEVYTVYNGINDNEKQTFNDWDEVDNYLNQKWGEYSASLPKDANTFGTYQTKDDFLSNFSVEIEPIEIDVEDIPQEGIELPIKPEDDIDVCECPECEDEPKCEVCPDCQCDPCECEKTDEDEIDSLEEDFDDETESVEDEKDVVNTPKEAKEKIDTIEDAIDGIEDFIQSLLDTNNEAENEEESENLDEMCMMKLPDPKTLKYNQGDEREKEDKKDKKKENEKKPNNEEFNDTMGMLTDINDLDFPDALKDTVDTKEDGNLYRISDIAKEVQELKATLKQEIADIKNDLKTALQDMKLDLKQEVNNVETKVQDTKTAVDDLTSEEEDLEDIELEEAPEEPTNEPEESEEDNEAAPEESEEDLEESLKTNPIYQKVAQTIKENKDKISIPSLIIKLKENYGLNPKSPSIIASVSSICTKTSLKENIIDLDEELKLKEEKKMNPLKKFLRSNSLLERCRFEKQNELAEDLQKLKQTIDDMTQQNKDAKEIKAAIELTADDENEETEAIEYAASKLKESLLKTSQTSKLNNLNS